MKRISKLVMGMLLVAMLGGMAVPAETPVVDDGLTMGTSEAGHFLSNGIQEERLRPVLEEELPYLNSVGGLTQVCEEPCPEHPNGHCPDTCVNCYQPKNSATD